MWVLQTTKLFFQGVPFQSSKNFKKSSIWEKLSWTAIWDLIPMHFLLFVCSYVDGNLNFCCRLRILSYLGTVLKVINNPVSKPVLKEFLKLVINHFCCYKRLVHLNMGLTVFHLFKFLYFFLFPSLLCLSPFFCLSFILSLFFLSLHCMLFYSNYPSFSVIVSFI
jgi:hypothetical protein